ncbi:MAG: hypothetical protein FWE19_07755 [Oscillospiraceae bacterium]|nr:hypothetical protein [Oscillospiraceae bacterium]
MTGKELKRKLVANGWVLTEGGNHTIATHHDRPGLIAPIHRHGGDIPHRNTEQNFKGHRAEVSPLGGAK